MSALSQDTFVAPGIAVSGAGGGGGGGGVTQLVAGSNITLSPAGGTGVVTVTAAGGGASPNASFSSITMSTGGTITNVGNLGVSSINGQAPGGGSLSPTPSFSSITMSTSGTISNLSTLAVVNLNASTVNAGFAVIQDTSVSSASKFEIISDAGTAALFLRNPTSEICIGAINFANNGVGVSGGGLTLAATDTYDANSLVIDATGPKTSSLTVSTINGRVANFVTNTEFTTFPPDKFFSSFANWANVGGFAGSGAFMSTVGAQVCPFISTITPNNRCIVTGNAIVTAESFLPAGSPNAYMGIFGGGGRATGLFTNNVWSYPQISTYMSFNGTSSCDLNWIAGGGQSFNNPNPGINPSGALSTINYFLYVSPDWPIRMKNETSTFMGAIANNDTVNTTITNLGSVTFTS
jgi:hypothetical protein